MDILMRIFQMILMLSILVVLHEFGHYFTARWFKMRVEKFYLFFDWPFKLFSKKIKDTEWGVGVLPLGGYVKIAGMIDESMDKEQLKEEPKPWEFRSKPAWQRLIVMLGGIIVNVLLAWFLYAILFSAYGNNYISTEQINKNGGYKFGEVGHAVGFQNGDQILAVDGKKQTQFKRQILDVLLGDSVLIEREGQQHTIVIHDTMKAQIFRKEGRDFISFRLKNPEIDSVVTGYTAHATLQKGDRILTVNDSAIQYYDEFQQAIKTHKNDTLSVGIQRNGKTMEVPLYVPDSVIVGIMPNVSQLEKLQTTVEYSNFFCAIPDAIEESFTMLVYNIKNIKLIFRPATEAYKQVRGPIGIMRIFPAEWDTVFFLSFTAMFSMWLAFINLVPIPGLDGGHALFTIAEMITGKKLNEKTMGIVQTIGMVILLALMALIFGKDIYDWVIDAWFTK